MGCKEWFRNLKYTLPDNLYSGGGYFCTGCYNKIMADIVQNMKARAVSQPQYTHYINQHNAIFSKRTLHPSAEDGVNTAMFKDIVCTVMSITEKSFSERLQTVEYYYGITTKPESHDQDNQSKHLTVGDFRRERNQATHQGFEVPTGEDLGASHD